MRNQRTRGPGLTGTAEVREECHDEQGCDKRFGLKYGRGRRRLGDRNERAYPTNYQSQDDVTIK